MRRVLMAALVAAAATMMLGAAPADAGGPTSVLLTNPGEARAAALYYEDPRYAELEELLHGERSPLAGGEQEPRLGGATMINVTWLVHDVSVWRTDTVLLDSSGGGWVTSSTSLDEPMASGTADWSPLAGAGQVRELAASLDLMGVGRSAGGPADAATATAATPPAPVVREETRWFSLSGWRWAVPGLLLGLVAAAATRRGYSGPGAPRQELVDRPRERVTTPG